MAGTTLQELIKRQDEARGQARKALSSAVTGKQPDPEETLKHLDRLIAEQGQRLDATRAAQAATNQRFEREIKTREARISELQSLADQVKRATLEPTKPTGPTRLQDVNGIGAVGEQRLKDAGIGDLQTLSKAQPERVAQLLNVSAQRATAFVTEAKRLSRS